MRDFIERQAAKEEFYKMTGWRCAIAVMDSIPAADVREVVRGEWEDAIQNCGDSPHVKCSVCGEYYWRYFKKFNYCPNCGAEMKGWEKKDA